MSVDTHPLLWTLCIEAGHRGVMGHLLCYEAHLVVLLWHAGLRAARRGLSGLWPLGELPGAVEGLAYDGVVGLLGDGTLAALVEGGEVVFDKANHAILRTVAVSDGHKQFRVGHEVCIHLQQRALLQDERGQHHLHRPAPSAHNPTQGTKYTLKTSVWIS